MNDERSSGGSSPAGFQSGLDVARERGVVTAPISDQELDLAVAVSGEAMNRAQVEVLRSTICSRLSVPQMLLYLTVCARKHVDPFTEAYAFVRKDGSLAFGLRIDGMRALSMRTGDYMTRTVETLLVPDGPRKGELMGAKCTVSRRGMTSTVVEEAYLAEYRQETDAWQRMPETMIRKVAEAKALRAAFPDALSGLYEPAEME